MHLFHDAGLWRLLAPRRRDLKDLIKAMENAQRQAFRRNSNCVEARRALIGPLSASEVRLVKVPVALLANCGMYSRW